MIRISLRLRSIQRTVAHASAESTWVPDPDPSDEGSIFTQLPRQYFHDSLIMPEPIDLSTYWASLQTRSPEGSNLLVIELEAPDLLSRSVLLCQDESRVRGVLLRVSSPGASLPQLKTAALRISHDSRTSDSGVLEHFIRIDCMSEELHAVFDKLIERVIQRLVQGSTAADACRDAVREFRRLLARSRGDLPAEEVIIGLIGELHLLLQLVEIDPNHWRSWIGVRGTNVDFSFADVDIECKTGRSSDAPRITVHGLDQLEPMNGHRLFLRHLAVEPNPSGPLHVPGLIDMVLRHVVDQEGFMDLIAQTPYESAQRDLWEEQAYAPVASTIFSVNDAFPRIRPSTFEAGQLPIAISSLRYDISLQHAVSCRLAEADSRALLNGLVSEVNA